MFYLSQPLKPEDISGIIKGRLLIEIFGNQSRNGIKEVVIDINRGIFDVHKWIILKDNTKMITDTVPI